LLADGEQGKGQMERRGRTDPTLSTHSTSSKFTDDDGGEGKVFSDDILGLDIISKGSRKVKTLFSPPPYEKKTTAESDKCLIEL